MPGAYKTNAYWLISCDAEKPNDARMKSGKYKKTKILFNLDNFFTWNML